MLFDGDGNRMTPSESCEAGSAGISVYEPQPDGAGIFRWASLTGKAASFGEETTQRDFGPCGLCR
jgi:hypothetical protein